MYYPIHSYNKQIYFPIQGSFYGDDVRVGCLYMMCISVEGINRNFHVFSLSYTRTVARSITDIYLYDKLQCLSVSAPPDSYEHWTAHPVMLFRMQGAGVIGNGRLVTCQTGNVCKLFIVFAVVVSKYRNKPWIDDYLFQLFNDAVSTSDLSLIVKL